MTKSNGSFPNKSSVDSNNRLLSSISNIEISPKFVRFIEEYDRKDKDRGLVTEYSLWKNRNKKQIQYCSNFHKQAKLNRIKITRHEWFQVRFCKACQNTRRLTIVGLP